jgi:uncharacterized protein YndB with AHSA1/START domain
MDVIKVDTIVSVPLDKAWQIWTNPEDVEKWNHASDDWFTPKAENDLRPGGKFNYRMEAKDGSFGFDFWGIYDEIILHRLISSTLGDGRKVTITFSTVGNKTKIEEIFEAEATNSIDLQKNGWQAILDNFKKHAEKSWSFAP